MLRRFEIYTMADDAPPAEVAKLEEAFRRCGDFIPEMTHSVVGNNLSAAPVDMVWEHAYDSPAAYQRYMVHPFHANILDRYLLNDSPERIVADSPLGDGTLVGYTCESPVYFMDSGLRKVVLFGLEGTESDVDAFGDELQALGALDGVTLSVLEPNTFGVAWFDGVTPILPPSQWTHVWELGFDSVRAYQTYQEGNHPVARMEAAQWKGPSVDVVRQAVALHYTVKL